MEKAILKTLIYADIFNYPLKAWEIHKWLVGKKASLRRVEKALEKMSKDSKIKSKDDYLFLPNKSRTVSLRIKKEKVSQKIMAQVKLIAYLFKVIPWVKMVGISGSLAIGNSDKNDDIDLFVVTQKNRLWISRLLLLLILELLNKRRKRGEKSQNVAGKVCINLLLDSDSLAFSKKDIYLAHEVLQMKLLWQRDGIYSQFLSKNDWVFRYLPNWTSGEIDQGFRDFRKHPNKDGKKISRMRYLSKFFGQIENISKWLQLRYMGKFDGKERIENGALFFHPKDYREKVLKQFNQGLTHLT